MNAPFVTMYDKPPTSRARYAWWRFVEHHLPMLVIYLLLATLIGVVLAPFMLVTVPSGYVGVLWKRFGGGTVLDPNKLKSEGMRITLPWNRVFLYDLRLQSATETYNAISRDGISLTATINIRFRLKREAVPQLHQSIGPNYIETLIEPEIGNRMREVIAEYTAEDVYSTKRAEIQDKIRQRAEAMMGEKMMSGGESEDQEENAPYRVPLYAMLNLIDTLILGIELPSAVVTAIDRKIEQYYISEEYKFRVAREIRESERKKIEAEGISEFQKIVSQGISDSYLRWRGIEATLQLAQSSNSKIVIVGNSKDGLPIILGNVVPRHRRNRHLRLETETLRPRKGRRLRLLHRHRRKRPLILCRSQWKRRHRLSRRKRSVCIHSRRVCPISKPCCPHSPVPRLRRRMPGKPDSSVSKKPAAAQQH